MKISALTLLTGNLAETKLFYEETIGFKCMGETGKSICLATGASALKFELAGKGQKPKYHFAFNIPSNKIEEALSWVANRTSLIQSKQTPVITSFENWKAKAIYFYDNNSNILEFISRTDLNNPSEIPFSVNSVININEAGLVTGNPLQTSQQIIEKTNANFFEKGPKGKDFAAVGNENGLFVIAKTGRNWFPTKDKAEKWKVKVKVKFASRDFELEFN